MTSRGQLYTIKELADVLRVHQTTIYRLLHQGRLPAFRVGSNWRFDGAAIERWQSAQAFETPLPIARGKKRKPIL
jgi:excisionase family DNA binding protein